MSDPARAGDPAVSSDRDGFDGGEAIVSAFQAIGADYVFLSPGSELAPVWEALARRRWDGVPSPAYVALTHETVAVGMATGYALIRRRAQGVLLHAGPGCFRLDGRARRAARGCIAVVAGMPNMGYTGVKGAAVATSPLSVAVPAAKRRTVLLDMATATIARTDQAASGERGAAARGIGGHLGRHTGDRPCGRDNAATAPWCQRQR